MLTGGQTVDGDHQLQEFLNFYFSGMSLVSLDFLLDCFVEQQLQVENTYGLFR